MSENLEFSYDFRGKSGYIIRLILEVKHLKHPRTMLLCYFLGKADIRQNIQE